jgi:hypothetical protein
MEENSTLSKKTQPLRDLVNVRFVGEPEKRDSNFAEFCLALRRAGAWFTVAGDRTITTYQQILDTLVGTPRDLFASHQRNDEIKVETAESTGERLRKSREEAKELTRWYMKNRR